MYNPKSPNAAEFIDNGEIHETLKYAEENKDNISLIDSLIKKALERKGLNHREAAVLLFCSDKAKREEIKKAAGKIKEEFYGKRIVLFAPLYLSNYCVNGCLYCPYHISNKHIQRKKLTQAEIADEVIALQDMGHKRLAVECGEDPVNNPLEYVLESINTIYNVKHKNGSIRRVNVNIAATTVENYKKLRDAEIGTYILFQETYDAEAYKILHPTGPKSDYTRQTEAADRAMTAGIEDVGLGVLFGLENYCYEFVGLLMHSEHLESVFNCGPHTISVPRVKPADDINPDKFGGGFPDDIFEYLIACIRIAVPYTGMIVSTREGETIRGNALKYGISQISGASRTSVGGYTEALRPKDTEQFEVSDERTLDEIVNWLMTLGYIPSFCTACYREGRVGGNFMKLLKGGHIAANCQGNALMTLQEFLSEYAAPDTQQKGEKIIETELQNVETNIKKFVAESIGLIKKGGTDFRV